MSYGIRNTLIMLVVLLLIYGSGYAYMHFIQKPEIERLELRVSNLEREYNQDQQTSDLVPMLREQYTQSRQFIDNYDKTIFRNNNPDEVFRFLTILNNMSNLNFNYIFQDSTITEDYGVIRSEISGNGSYRGLMTFINAIENSEPVQKINNIVISPVGMDGGYQNVNFTFTLNSNYDTHNIFDSPERTPGIATRTLSSNHNPFFPLIRSVEPNVDDLPNIDSSRLIGLSSSAVFLLNQNGRMITIRQNDRVYLGRLETINVREGKATFRLNRGGIIDLVTLEVQR
jgi:Tfp pilus assembly protein PilO